MSWTFTKVADPGTTCTTKYTTTLHPKIKCTDDAVVTATLRVSDGINPPIFRTTTVTFINKAPSIGTVCLPTSPVSVGTAVKISASFADAGRNDTHTVSIAWGDSTTSGGTHLRRMTAAGPLTGSHAYSSPGAYHVTVTITDDDRGATTSVSTKTVVVYSTQHRLRDRRWEHRFAVGLVHAGEHQRRRRRGPGELRLRREVAARVAHADGQHGVPAPPAQGWHRPAVTTTMTTTSTPAGVSVTVGATTTAGTTTASAVAA